MEAAADVSGAMETAIERLGSDGREPETTPEYGLSGVNYFFRSTAFRFVRRGADRRLQMLTPRDPHATAVQSFSPFKWLFDTPVAPKNQSKRAGETASHVAPPSIGEFLDSGRQSATM